MTILKKLRDNDEKTLHRYKCDFCERIFERWVGKRNRELSDQVKCKGCGNFIKTWE